MCIVHFYYPEMICYNYVFKSCEKNLNTFSANDNILEPNQFDGSLFSKENSGQKQASTVVNTSGLGTNIRQLGSIKDYRLKRHKLDSAGAIW